MVLNYSKVYGIIQKWRSTFLIAYLFKGFECLNIYSLFKGLRVSGSVRMDEHDLRSLRKSKENRGRRRQAWVQLWLQRRRECCTEWTSGGKEGPPGSPDKCALRSCEAQVWVSQTVWAQGSMGRPCRDQLWPQKPQEASSPMCGPCPGPGPTPGISTSESSRKMPTGSRMKCG